MTIPALDTLSTYGGELNDYVVAVTDPTTDRSASAVNQAYASIAGMTRTAPRAWVQFTGHATTPVLVSWEAVWKGSDTTAPTVARTGTGVFTITFATTITDELGDVQTLAFRRGSAQVASSTNYEAQCVKTAANQVTVYTFVGSSGAADNLAAIAIDVDIY